MHGKTKAMRRSALLTILLFGTTALMTLPLLIFETAAEADMRDYLFNQDYDTSKKGEFELEFYNDLNMPNKDNSDTYNLLQQYELEYGITDHLQMALYNVVTWNRAQDWRQDAWKLEGKYRFLESGELPVDIALYGEYKNPNGSSAARSDEVEMKLILGKNIGAWNVTGNFVAEREINQHEAWQLEYTLGARCPVTPRLHVGLELKESLGNSEEFGPNQGNHKLQLMPIVGFSPTPKTRILFGPAIGLTHHSDDIQLKSIVSVEF